MSEKEPEGVGSPPAVQAGRRRGRLETARKMAYPISSRPFRRNRLCGAIRARKPSGRGINGASEHRLPQQRRRLSA